MSANSPLNGTRPAADASHATAGSQDPDVTTPGRQLAPDPAASPGDAILSPAEQIIAERTERRRQRAAAHNAATPPRKPRTPRRRERGTQSTSAVTPARRMTLRDSVSITLIGTLAAGGILGAILGALSVAGWVIGLLVAGLTIILSALVRHHSRLT
jgi:hypothetical protein